MITADEVREVVEYEPETGKFSWLVTNGRKRLSAGYRDSEGYLRIFIGGKQNGRTFRASRLAWLMMTGEWPKYTIDHKNRKRDDDRWANLREATRAEQAANRGPRRRPETSKGQ